MRIAVAEIAQETDSFSPLVTTLKDFETYGIYFGDDVVDKMRGVGPIGGFLQIAAEQCQAFELLGIVRAWASAGGIISAETFDYLRQQLVEGLRGAMPIDAVFLSLHGAAAAQSDDDVEGNLLAAVRRVVGNETPVIVALDHHANITQRMVDGADALIGHETQPHDPPATGRKAAKVLFAMLRGDISPTMAWQKIPMITPQDQFLTSRGPMQCWFGLAREMERRGGVVDVSPYPMQPWLDVAEGGWSVVVHCDDDPQLAQRLAAEMAERAWQMRERFWQSERLSAETAVRRAVEAERGLVVLSDTGDSVYGGAAGESTCILEELVLQNVSDIALVPMVAAQAVQKATDAGVGGEITVAIGHQLDQTIGCPLELTGRVAALSRGLTVELAERGPCNLGSTALLEVGRLRIVLLDQRSFGINHPVLYTHLGLEVAEAKMVVVKTASNFQFFAPWTTEVIRVDSPGATQSDLKAFQWKRIPRPVHGLDELDDWRPVSER